MASAAVTSCLFAPSPDFSWRSQREPGGGGWLEMRPASGFIRLGRDRGGRPSNLDAKSGDKKRYEMEPWLKEGSLSWQTGRIVFAEAAQDVPLHITAIFKDK